MKSNSEHGFVLVAVIWLCGLIAALTIGLATRVRIDTLATTHAIHDAEAGLAADGLLRLAAWRLATKPGELEEKGVETYCLWRLGTIAGVTIQDQTGLIDLNTVPPAIALDLFKSLGAPVDQASQLSSELIDYRDADSEKQGGGTEPVLYANAIQGPKNAALEAKEEIDQLPSMTDELYHRLLPLVTVHSGQAGIDPASAPAALRQAFGQSREGTFKGQLADYAAPSPQLSYAIRVRIWTNNPTPHVKEAVAVMLRQPERPFAFLTWQRLHVNGDSKLRALPTNTCFN